jgi:hypothetical protein
MYQILNQVYDDEVNWSELMDECEDESDDEESEGE